MRRVLALAALLLASAAPAAAQDRGTAELTPLIGLRAGGRLTNALTDESFSIEPSWSWGFVAGLAPWSPNLILEGTYLQQLTRASSDTTFGVGLGGLHSMRLQTALAGVQWDFSPKAAVRPFVSLGLGATSLEAQGGGKATSFTTVLSGGVKVMTSRHFGLRFELRTITMFETFSTVDLCRFSECDIGFPGGATLQVDLALGTVFAF